MNLVKKIIISSLAVMISGVVLAQDPAPVDSAAAKPAAEVAAPAAAAPAAETPTVKNENAATVNTDASKTAKKTAKKAKTVKKSVKKSARKVKGCAVKKVNKVEKVGKKITEDPAAAVEGTEKTVDKTTTTKTTAE